MALNDVKELKVPDSRYRELEYIIFNGAEYVNTGLDNTNSDLELKLSVKKSVFPSQRGTVWTLLGSQDGASYPSEIDKYWLGCIDYSSHYSNYSTPRFIGHWHTGSAGIYPDASYTTNAWNLFTDDDVVRIVYGGVKSTSGNSYTWECGVKDLEGNILFSNEHTGNTSYTMSNKF